jgi:oligopeptide/dipeptide ABC transporter ATP-binding protein
MQESILEIRDLKKYFHGSAAFLSKMVRWIKAVDGVSFRVFRGDTFGLVGESGCGKSTLGKTILGIYNPTAGSVIFEGKDISHLSRKEAKETRKHIQYVYQDPGASLDPYWKVGRILAEPLVVHASLSRETIRERVREMLANVGLKEEHLSLYPHEFSGGQQRRLGLARILCLNPRLVILDEPTSGLDVSVQATILKLFMELKARFALTYIFISHNLSVVHMMCNRLGVMYAGKIVEMGDTRAIFREPVHPYSQVLLAAIPQVGKRLGEENHLSLTGEPPNPEDFPPGCRFWPRCRYKVEICETVEPALQTRSDGRTIACHRTWPRSEAASGQ